MKSDEWYELPGWEIYLFVCFSYLFKVNHFTFNLCDVSGWSDMFIVYNGWTQKHDWETNGKGEKKVQVNDSQHFYQWTTSKVYLLRKLKCLPIDKDIARCVSFSLYIIFCGHSFFWYELNSSPPYF